MYFLDNIVSFPSDANMNYSIIFYRFGCSLFYFYRIICLRREIFPFHSSSSI